MLGRQEVELPLKDHQRKGWVDDPEQLKARKIAADAQGTKARGEPLEAERRPVSRVFRRWREKEGIYFTGLWEAREGKEGGWMEGTEYLYNDKTFVRGRGDTV